MIAQFLREVDRRAREEKKEYALIIHADEQMFSGLTISMIDNHNDGFETMRGDETLFFSFCMIDAVAVTWL